MPEWWGGYQLLFKIAPEKKYQQRVSDISELRRNAEVVGPNNKRKFTIDISKYEFCLAKHSRKSKAMPFMFTRLR